MPRIREHTTTPLRVPTRFWDVTNRQPLMRPVLTMATDIASAMAFLHSKNIIHGGWCLLEHWGVIDARLQAGVQAAPGFSTPLVSRRHKA